MALLLTGCGGATSTAGGIETGSTRALYEVLVPLSDGRTVACIKYSAGGLSCDWAGAR